MSQKITPCLWFDSNAEEAVNFYISLFKDAKLGTVSRYDEASAKVSGKPAGSVLAMEFTLNGMDFLGMNGGPMFKFSPATSFMIDCKDQEEVDHFWNALSDSGQIMDCGWVTDKFGMTWQVVPSILNKYLSDKDPKKAKATMEAMLKMKKLIVADLEKAHEEA